MAVHIRGQVCLIVMSLTTLLGRAITENRARVFLYWNIFFPHIQPGKIFSLKIVTLHLDWPSGGKEHLSGLCNVQFQTLFSLSYAWQILAYTVWYKLYGRPCRE